MEPDGVPLGEAPLDAGSACKCRTSNEGSVTASVLSVNLRISGLERDLASR